MIDIKGYILLKKINDYNRFVLYRGLRKSDEKPVLIKHLISEYPSHEELEQIENEYQFFSEFNINGSLKPISYEDVGHSRSIIFESFDGITLDDFSNKNILSLKEKIDIIIKITEIINEIHQNLLIHKNISLNSIIINEETNEIRITDFSLISLLARESKPITNPKMIEGDLLYISPEQTGRMNRSVDYRSDYYSLGVIFYRLATSILPFENNFPIELVHAHIARQPEPPHLINSEIPIAISKIIMKLLSKTAEERYQTIKGLQSDLTTCLSYLDKGDKIPDFIIAQNDKANKLLIPEKLYGRENEINILHKAIDQISYQKNRIILFSGPPGIGKSFLINEMQKMLLEKKGFLISGKFDQYKRNIPYSSIIQAFQELIRQLLTESEDKIFHWRQVIQNRLKENGKIITDVIPDLEHIIGKQKKVPLLSPTETQNRFNTVFQNFIKSFLDMGYPIILFLDDLQWADSGSLKLINVIITDHDLSSFLLLGSFRDAEVNNSHPLILLIDKLINENFQPEIIPLKPLELQHINSLLSDALNLDTNQVSDLSDLIKQKTGGNPFFVKEFIINLYNNELLTFKDGWNYNITDIKESEITDNIVELMINRVKRLPEKTQDLLKYCACIGKKYSFNILNKLYDDNSQNIIYDLKDAIDQGLVIKLNGHAKFSHDRVHEAIYTQLEQNDREEIHYKIGKELLNNIKENNLHENIFDIVHQLNNAIPKITEINEIIEIAQYNLNAGLKAKSSSAYESSYQFFKQGVNLLQENSWETNYKLCLNLFTEYGESAYLIGNHNEAENLLNQVLLNAQSTLDKIHVYEIKIAYYTANHKMNEALNIGKDALQLLGASMPTKANRISILKELIKLKLKLKNNDIENLINLKGMEDEKKLAIARILMSCSEPAYLGDPEYLPIIILKLLNLSLEYGNSKYSAYAYVTFGLIQCGYLNNIDKGYKYGRLALAVFEKFNAIEMKSKIYMVFASMINHWKNHMHDDLEYLIESYNSGYETGDLSFATYAVNAYMVQTFYIGFKLEDMKLNMEKYYDFIIKSKLEGPKEAYDMWYQMILNLLGQSEDKCMLIGDSFNEGIIIPKWIEAVDYNRLGAYTLAKQIIYYLNDEHEKAISITEKGTPYLKSMSSMVFIPAYYFYYSLALLSHYSETNKKKKKKYLKIILNNQKKFKEWTEHAPVNYSHKYLLIEAEIFRLKEDFHQALKLYNKAIDLAQKNGYRQDEAIANELTAKYLLSMNMEKTAIEYLKDAHYLYNLWGAKIKTQSLEDKYPTILSQTESSIDRDGAYIIKDSQSLDMNAVISASHIISGEIVLERLLEQMMKITMENAGAERCLILIEREDKLHIEAEGNIERNTTNLLSVELNDYFKIPRSIINYSKRTLETIILDDAKTETMFNEDEYIKNNLVRSILCIPLIRQKKFLGLIYLENNLSARAFTPERIEIIRLISTQATISLENSLLFEKTIHTEKEIQQQYEEIQGQYEEMESMNDELENTHRELMRTNEDLAIFKKFAETSGQGFCMSDLDGNVIYTNTSYCSMIGVNNPADLIGNNIKNNYLAEFQDNFKETIITQAMNDEQWIGELKIITQEGQEIPTFQNIFIIRDNFKEPQYIAYIITNINKLKETENALKTSEEQNRNLVETMKDGIAVLDKNEKLIYTNDALSDMLGYNHEEMLQKSLDIYLDVENSETLNKQLSNRQDGIVDTYELEWITKNGDKIFTIVSPQIIFDSDGNYSGSFGVITNITEKKNLEKQLQKAQKMEAIGNLAGGIAHDFNNYLTAITGYSGLMLNQMAPHDPLIDYVDEIIKAAEKSASLTRQLLAFSRNQILKWELINLNEIVTDMKKMLGRLIGEDIRLITDLDNNLSYIYGDKGQVEQTIMNLMVNARDAMPIGGKIEIRTTNVTIDDENEIPESKPGEYIVLTISDTGVGMADEIVSNIFDPFFTTKDLGQGTGLGLSVVYGIINQHNGWITIDSKLNIGSTFQIYLPIADVQNIEKVGKQDVFEFKKGNNEKILIVEDQKEVRKFAELALKKNKYNIISSESIAEALEKYHENNGQFDLIFSDVVLPDGNGTQLVEELLNINPDLKILMTSGYTDKKSQTEIIFEKGYPFLQKPYTLEVLLTKISEIFYQEN